MGPRKAGKRRESHKRGKHSTSKTSSASDVLIHVQLPSQHRADFEAVAALIAPPTPPEWLADHLRRWAPSVFLSRHVENQQPTRAEMKKILDQVAESAGLLQRALAQPSICEFLNAGGESPMDSADKFRWIMNEICSRAVGATRLPILVTPSGKVKAGKGRAMPEGATSAQTFCALIIVEAWNWCRHEYPAPGNEKLCRAIDQYWGLAGGPTKRAWGNNRFIRWRHFVRNALSAKSGGETQEIRRHMREAESATAMFISATQDGH